MMQFLPRYGTFFFGRIVTLVAELVRCANGGGARSKTGVGGSKPEDLDSTAGDFNEVFDEFAPGDFNGSAHLELYMLDRLSLNDLIAGQKSACVRVELLPRALWPFLNSSAPEAAESESATK
jgi:hypothetical protein